MEDKYYSHHTYIYFQIFLHTCTYLPRIKIIKCMHVCMYVCMMILHCPGPGYWLLYQPVVPPLQSDHCKQLLSGESIHSIRHEKERHIIHVSHTKVSLYKHTYILINSREIIINWTKNINRVGQPPYHTT